MGILSKINTQAIILDLKLFNLAQPSAYPSALFESFLVSFYLGISSLCGDGI
jgi:hypothetical protein